jgi:hypothetical protein
MRKIYLTFALMFFVQICFGQKVVSDSKSVQIPTNSSHFRQFNDTLWGQFDQWSSAFYSPVDTGGFLAGNNGYGDLQKAQAFQIQDRFSIEKCILWFGAKKLESGNPNSNVLVKVMTLDGPGINAQGQTPNSAPNTVLATATLPAADIDTTQGFWNIVTFSNPPTLNGNFAVSVDFSALADGDTATLVHSQDGQGNVFNDLSWEQQSDSVWVSFAYDGAGGWGLDVQLGVFPIGEEIVGINESGKLSFKLYPAFPNPIKESGYIFYELLEAAEVKIQILDITGRLVGFYNEGLKPAGKSMFEMNASDFNSGMYFFGINIRGQEEFKKIIIAK